MRLNSLGALAATLAAGIERHEAHKHERLEHAARLVEAEAKRIVGEYQDAAGPFPAWAPLADRTLETNVNNTPGLVTGEMRDSIGHAVDAEAGEAAIGSSDPKLLWFELGTKTQPPRSVLGIAIIHEEKAIVRELGHGTVRTLIGGGEETEF